MAKLSFVQAVCAAQREELRRDPSVFLMGEDVTHNVLGSSEGFLEEFGPDRIRDTPISEAGFLGAGVGAAMVGMRPIVDMLMAPFLYVAADQVISIAAKSTYLYGGQARVPLTIRAPMLYGPTTANAGQHSDRPYPIFMTVPGIKIVVPSTPSDAKGLLKSAVRDDNPVIIFEDSNCWGLTEDVPDGDFTVPLGKADIKRPGTDVTLVAIGGAVPCALDAADQLAEAEISVEVIDPRTLVPLDRTTILESVERTGRLIVADPAHRTCSAASEIASIVAEEGFWGLRAPIALVTTPDTHIPFSTPLEAPLYPSAERIATCARELMMS